MKGTNPSIVMWHYPKQKAVRTAENLRPVFSRLLKSSFIWPFFTPMLIVSGSVSYSTIIDLFLNLWCVSMYGLVLHANK